MTEAEYDARLDQRERPASPDRGWRVAQAVSGLVFGAFVALHLLNHTVALFGQDAYDAYLRFARHLYQHPAVEIGLLFTALLVHIAAGVRMVVARRRKARSTAQGPSASGASEGGAAAGGAAAGSAAAARKPPLITSLHRYSAYFLLVVIVGHIAATRLPVVAFDTPVAMSFVTFSIERLPFVFFPYYVLLFSAGAFHGLRGLQVALGVLGLRPPGNKVLAKRPTRVALAIVVVAALAVIALSGALHPVDRSRYPDYERLVERVYG